MADSYKMWIHGVNVVAQHTALSNEDDRGLFMMPLSWGMVVRQDAGTYNWFHLALPTPTRLDDHPSYHYDAWLNVEIADQAEITDAHVYNVIGPHDRTSFSKTPINDPIPPAGYRSFSGQLEFDLRDLNAVGPMVLSVRVEFDGALGGPAEQRQITFWGAGAHFEEISHARQR